MQAHQIELSDQERRELWEMVHWLKRQEGKSLVYVYPGCGGPLDAGGARASEQTQEWTRRRELLEKIARKIT